MSKFHYFSRLTPERVDKEAGIIRGVSIITSGIQAKGHPLGVDDETVHQMFSVCAERGIIKNKANHKSGVKDIGGFFDNFREVECATGIQLKADWNLLKKDPSYEHTMEIAERMPQTVGLSASFTSPKGFEKGQDTKFGKMARVKEVLSVDFVTDPAANPDGLFEIGGEETSSTVDNAKLDMTTEEMLAQLLKNQTELSAAVQGIQEFNENLVAEREAFETAQAEAQEEEVETEIEETETDEPSDDPRDVELSELRAAVIELQARNAEADQAEEAGKYETALSMLREKVTLLAAQRDEAIAELESYKTPRVSTSSDGVRLFSKGAANQSEFEQHISQFKAGSKEQREAIREFIATQPDLYQLHLESKEPVAAINLSRNGR